MAKSSNSLTDIKILLDFLKQDDDESSSQAQITSLQALSSMCTKEAAEIINQCGGLGLIWKLCGSTQNPEVCQSCLYTLACAAGSNARVKLTLSSAGIFRNVQKILNFGNIPDRTRMFAIYFLISLVTDCESGQDLLMKSGCFDSLLQIFVSGVKLTTCGKLRKRNYNREVWVLASKALRSSVTCPRNEINQMYCAKYIPHMITILHESKSDEEIVLQACQLFGAVVEENKFCREKAFTCRALEVLVLTLQSCYSDVESSKLTGEIVTCLNHLLSERDEYCERFGKLGGMVVFIRILDTVGESLDLYLISNVLTILSCCVSFSESNRRQLIRYDAASIIVRLMNTVDGDKYFNKIAATVLDQCMQKTEGNGSNKNGSSSDTEADEEKSSSYKSDILDTNTRKYALAEEDKIEEAQEMINGGGSCITDILERQQTQIEMLQTLLLQERDKRLENEKTIIAIANSNQASVCGMPMPTPLFRSDHLPLSANVRRCPSQSWSVSDTPKTREKRIFNCTPNVDKATKAKSRREPQNILTSTLMTSPMHRNVPAPTFISPDLNKLVQDSQESLFTVSTSCQTDLQDSGCQTETPSSMRECSRDISMIDVETVTPRTTSSEIKRKLMKCYVERDSKVKQHVSRKLHDNSTSLSSTECRRRNIDMNNNVEDDMFSVCSEIINQEVRKSKKTQRRSRSTCISTIISPKLLKSRPTTREHSRHDDVYSYEEPSSSMDAFKKPMLPPPRSSRSQKAKRIKFSSQEVKDLEKGVKRLGPHFKEILYTYKFHPSRSSTDLRDKYRNICTKNGMLS